MSEPVAILEAYAAGAARHPNGAPLVDLAREKGFAAHSVTGAEGVVRTYFQRSAAAPHR